MAEKPVHWGESVSAVCNVVSGDAPLDINWAFNGINIAMDDPHISITTTKRNSLISIDSASPTNAGEYSCTVNNAGGGTSLSASLVVNGTLDENFINAF